MFSNTCSELRVKKTTYLWHREKFRNNILVSVLLTLNIFLPTGWNNVQMFSKLIVKNGRFKSNADNFVPLILFLCPLGRHTGCYGWRNSWPQVFHRIKLEIHTSQLMFSCEFWEIISGQLFYGTPPDDFFSLYVGSLKFVRY